MASAREPEARHGFAGARPSAGGLGAMPGASARFSGASARVSEPPVRTVDPVTLGVIWGALRSIAVEIGTTVHRTAYSEQAREGQDFSVAVFDAAGRMVAQGPYSPGHMGAMS